MDRIKVVIVDDEKKAREGLAALVLEDDDLQLIRQCKDGVEALDVLNSQECDLLLLDIQMPAVTGFEVLKSLKAPPFTIFITAYDQYALRAFEYHALDYLLKPFTNDRFYQALNHAKEVVRSTKSVSHKKLRNLIDYLESTDEEPQLLHSTQQSKERIVIKTDGKIILVKTKDIEWVESDDYYIKIHLDGQQYMIRESLKSIIQRLPQDKFIRVHKSAIINSDCIRHLEHLQNAEYMITMESGTQVKVSRSYRKELDAFLGDL